MARRARKLERRHPVRNRFSKIPAQRISHLRSSWGYRLDFL